VAMSSSDRLDQLDMACEMATRRINKSFNILRGRVAQWEPRRMVMFHIDIPNDQDRVYADEWRKHRDRDDR
jgi:hypothetical protein